MYLGDSDIDNNVVTQEKVKADLFEAILGAIAIDSDWNADIIQNSVATMLDIDKFWQISILQKNDLKSLRKKTL